MTTMNRYQPFSAGEFTHKNPQIMTAINYIYQMGAVHKGEKDLIHHQLLQS
jgi:hypothetical protein